jgi:hypothetical protein
MFRSGNSRLRLTAAEEAELSAVVLAGWLRQGHVPPDIHPSLPGTGWLSTYPGERCKHQAACGLFVFCAAEAYYGQSTFLAGGSAKMVAGSLAASALYNRHQRRKAEAEAAPRWRLVTEGPMLVTTMRILVTGPKWISLFYRDLDYAAHDAVPGIGGGIRVGVNGSDPLFLALGASSLWLYVLLTYLGRGEVARFALSESLERKVVSSRESGMPRLGGDGQPLQLPSSTP